MQRTTTRAVLLFLTVLAVRLASSQDTCGSIGDSDQRELNARTDRRFYLDTNNPATCTGTITSWRVCYYGPDDARAGRSYWATYAVYRRMGSGGSERYERVSQLFSAVRATSSLIGTGEVDGLIQEDDYVCYDDSIDTGDLPLTVQAGDVLGACVFNPDNVGGDNRRQLDIVGETGGSSLFEMNDDGCTTEALPSNIPSNQLSNRNNRRLHLFANIEPIPITTTSAPTTSSMATTDPATTTTTDPSSMTTTDPTTITTMQAQPPSSTVTSDNQGVTTIQGVDNTAAATIQDAETTSDSEIPSVPIGARSDTGLTPGAIAGLAVGLLLSLVLGVAIVMVLVALYLMKRKGKYSTGKEHALDNITYGIGGDKENGNVVEAGVYEVPLSLKRDTEPTYDPSGSIYATPNVYEYATLGPNEEMGASSGQYYSPLDEVSISYSKLLEKNKQEDIYGNVEEYLQPATGKNELYSQIKACGIRNIPSKFIQINGHLGSGQFGSVEQGVWKDGAKSILVAVKLLKEGASETDRVKFLQEAAIMAQFKHPNVVALYGVVSQGKSLKLVVELIQKGDLRNYLHTLRPDPGELPVASMPKLLLSFSQQVALGMHYLSAKQFVHRDLAARNILVSKDNICKVADFGMSRDLTDEAYYVSQGGQIPVKWTAPEAIHYKKYSTTSDVWSYGCLLYEIWSIGYKPFEGVWNTKVIQLVDSGQRLSPPPGCPRLIYELMIKCWNPAASNRPGFREILLSLLGSPEEVLSIPTEVLDTHHLAGVLGSPLEAGESMYSDLHNKYLLDNDYQELN